MTEAREEEATSFKLFGAVIHKGDRHAREEEEEEEPAHGPPMDQVAAAEEQARVAPALPCPRCKSTDTKFCYFNNYNVNQPRHFCKACHRYWTSGGTLRNVPVGAGRRRGRPARRVGGSAPPASAAPAAAKDARGVPPAACVLGFRAPEILDGGAAVERWLLRAEATARVDRGRGRLS